MVDFIGGLRQVIQDLLIPEFKALQGEVRHLREQMEAQGREASQRFEALSRVMNERFEKVEQRFARVDERFEALVKEMNERFEKVDERFARVDERFEALTREMNERFDRVHQEILALTKSVATMDGKLDVLVGHIVDYKEAVRLTVRVEDLEKRVAELAKKVGG